MPLNDYLAEHPPHPNPYSATDIIALLHELAAEGATLVLITHDAEIAASFGRRLQMRDGEIVADDRT